MLYMNATVQSLQWLLHVSGQGTDHIGTGAAFFQFSQGCWGPH